MNVIVLHEYSQQVVPYAELTEASVMVLQRQFAQQVQVELMLAGEKGWRLTTVGWVGTIPLGAVQVVIRPKIPALNLFKMLAVAYDLPIRKLDGLVQSAEVEGVFAQLADWLLVGILERARQGLHRAYVPKQDTLPYLRGRLRVRELTDELTKLPVSYSQFSADIPHNQLLLHTLNLIAQTVTLTPASYRQLERARQLLRGSVSTVHFDAHKVDQLTYDRLNADYRPLHALCRFFIDNASPHHDSGPRDMLPLLINMASLFERFVARWLAAHLPPQVTVVAQERSSLSEGQIDIEIDLVLKDVKTGKAVCVLDTKWKSAEKPSNSDLYQIAFYANSRQSPAGALIYPSALARPLDATVRNVVLRSLVFDVSAEVDAAGEQFMIQLKNLIAPRGQEAKGPSEEKEQNGTSKD